MSHRVRAGFGAGLAITLAGVWACSTEGGSGASGGGGGSTALAGGGNYQQMTAGTSAQGAAAPVGGASTNGGQVGTGGSVVPGGGNAQAGSPSGGTGVAGNPPGPALGPAQFADGDLDAATDGGTITFTNLGKAGSYPSRRDPASGMCDVFSRSKDEPGGACCMTKHAIAGDKLTPWDEELIVTLRGPMQVKQFAVYTSEDGMQWGMQSAWDSQSPATAFGIAFHGDATKGAKFAGTVGSQCISDAMTDKPFPCGPNSVPYCPADAAVKNYGWAGSKLYVIAARMPMMGGGKIDAATACPAVDTKWFNAPWIGISLGELIREDKFGPCNCYGKNPVEWYAGDGCGQINAFEVVNDNNDFQNFDVFSSNIFAYYGNVGEGPCGNQCNVAGKAPADLIDKATSQPAAMGGVTPYGGAYAHVAFRRPTEGYRYFLALFDVNTRTMQLAVIHPNKLPAAAAGLLPNLPKSLGRATIDALVGMRLPH